MCIKKYFGKSILNAVFSKYFQQLKKVFEILKYKILNGEYFKYQILNTKSISNTYFKYKYFKYCPALSRPNPKALLCITVPCASDRAVSKARLSDCRRHAEPQI